MSDPKQDQSPVIPAHEWLRQFATSGTPRLSKDEAMRLAFIAGQLRGYEENMREFQQARDEAVALLDKIALAVKGEPEPGCAWGFADLPDICEALAQRVKGLH